MRQGIFDPLMSSQEMRWKFDKDTPHIDTTKTAYMGVDYSKFMKKRDARVSVGSHTDTHGKPIDAYRISNCTEQN